MGKRLFVGNFPWSVTEQDLRAEFEKCGEVREVKIVTDRETGKSRGFAFVEFASDAEAAAAIKELHGINYGGRDLVVKIAEDRRPSINGGNRGPRDFAPSAPAPQYGGGPPRGGNGGKGKPKRGGGSRRRRDDDYDTWG